MSKRAATENEKMLTTTLNRIRVHHPCESGWRKLLLYLGKTQPDDEPLHRRIGYLILLTLAAAGGVVLAGALLQIAERVWQ